MRLYASEDDKYISSIVCVLIVARLFALYGATADELCDALTISKPTLQRRLKRLRQEGIVSVEKTGRKVYYACDLEELERRASDEGSSIR